MARPRGGRAGVSRTGRWMAGAVALAAAAAALGLAWRHPLSGPAAVFLVVAAMAGLAARPGLWPVLLPAAWPVLGLAPRTGWLLVEESDLALLAVVAAVLGRHALRPPPAVAARTARPLPLLALSLCLVWTVLTVLAMWRGVQDAGGWPHAALADQGWWWQGYREPMNALRLAKPALALLLLWPAWTLAQRVLGEAQVARRLSLGMALGLGAVAAVCLWERLAFTGLLNFSSDYRTTGPFWEMHVGGAALDAFLAMGLPFALWLWREARSPQAFALAAGLCMLAAYAALTTFSRIVYLALPLGIVLQLWLVQRQGQPRPRPMLDGDPPSGRMAKGADGADSADGALGPALVWCGVVTLLAAWVFPTSGYRGMLAVLGQAALLLVMVPLAAAPPPSGASQAGRRVGLVVLAMLVVAAVLAVGSWLPKGPYWMHGTAVLGGLALAAWAAIKGTGLSGWGRVALWAAAATGVQVAWHWGGAAAGWAMLPVPVLAVLALPLLRWLGARRRAAPWPAHWRWQASVLFGLALCAAGVGVFSGGDYMSGRLQAAQDDRQGRLDHWRVALAGRQSTSDHWLGVGLGRFLDHYALHAPPRERPGDIRLVATPEGPVMRLVAGTHVQGFGQLLRLSQRIPVPEGPLTLSVTLRSRVEAPVHAEVCLKHLLYDDGCWVLNKGVPASTQWQTHRWVLKGDNILAHGGLWRRPAVFSLATELDQAPVDVREISLTDAAGRQQLVNGRFEHGGARWFFSSDRHHMPWHAKSLAVHLLFEQGYLGLGLAAAMGVLALHRLIWGAGRHHPLAPALAAALLGVAVVGLVDSLLDMPRVALAMWGLTLLSLSLHARPGTRA